ncbi:MAG: CsgG/HfaB family protein [Candidatus Cloacimonetes bacterium]|nr:CsgG/HfaB family protein [Candidatus Cloacimonadota bacterium]
MIKLRNFSILILFVILFSGCANVQTGKYAQAILSKNFSQNKYKRIAIMPFQNVGKSGIDQTISDQFTIYFMRLGFTIIERSQIESILIEMDLKMDQPLTQKQLKEVGNKLSIDALLMGTMSYSYQPGSSQASGFTGKILSETPIGTYEGSSTGAYHILTQETLRLVSVESGEILISASGRPFSGGSISYEIYLKLKSLLNIE